MIFMEIISWIVKGYVMFEASRTFITNRPLPIQVRPMVVYYAFVVINYVFWMVPHSKIQPFVLPVYSLINTWTFLISGITTWIIIECLYSKYTGVRIFVNKYRKFIFKVLILLLIVFFYVKIIEYYKIEYGTCLPVKPYDYFMHRYIVQAKSRFWQSFYNFFMILVLVIAMCTCCYFFMVPISIA